MSFLRPACRSFSCSASARARRTLKDLQKARMAFEASATEEELQEHLFRESDKAFGEALSKNPMGDVNKAADEAFKEALRASGNDPEVYKAWRDNIKLRPSAFAENPFTTPPDSKPK